jgi:hypothetical protein
MQFAEGNSPHYRQIFCSASEWQSNSNAFQILLGSPDYSTSANCADISFEALSLQNFPMFYRELSLCTFHAVACHFDSLADQFQRQQRVPNML